jgi:hypothetical protein
VIISSKTDTVRTKELLGKTSLDTLIEKNYNKLRIHIGMDSLSPQFHGTEIRIWSEYSYDKRKVIQIRSINNIWSFIAHRFTIKSNKDGSDFSIEKESEELEPVNTWNFFITRMEKYGIYNIRDFSEIPDYHLALGGDAIVVEIAKNNSYKKYRFPCFVPNELDIAEVQHILQIIFLIQREFRFNLLDDP